MSVSREQVMKLVDEMYALWNSQNLSAAGEVYTLDYSGFDVTDQSRANGVEGVTKQLERFYRAFPDLYFSNEEAVLDGDRVSLFWSARGTHKGTMLNIPPTGRTVNVNGVSLLRIAEGKIARGVHLWDLAALLRDIGLLPALEKRHPLDPVSLKDALTICD